MSDATPNLATLGQRFMGALIDSIIAAVLVSIVLAAFFLQGASFFERLTSDRVMVFVIGTICLVVVQGYPLLARGQTIGKIVMKTKIVDLQGNLPTAVKVLGFRYIAFNAVGLIPWVGSLVRLADVLFIFASDRRCLHDHVAGTQVVTVDS